MQQGTDQDAQRRLMDIAFRRTDLTIDQLWVRYFALGGTAGPMDVDAYLNGLTSLELGERDSLAAAINERLDEMVWRHRAPYSQALPEVEPETGVTAALVRLLEGTHMAQADQLSAVLHAAGRAIDVDLTMYLVGYDQRQLVPVPRPGQHTPSSIDVVGTMAGRAFQLVDTVTTHGGEPRLWVPLLDGVEQLGVLEAVPDPGVDLGDPTLRRNLMRIAAQTGHLVTILGQHGDALETVRRQRPRTIAAELIWSLLPPLSFATDRFVISALLEPAYEVGGDAFDYAVNGDTAHFAIFDATGHSLGSGTAAAVALAAYRNGRRDGARLYDLTRQIDQAVGREFTGERYVTAVLAEVDLTSGLLRYVGAGHPYPLILRRGSIVKTLTGGRRPLFGVDHEELTVGQEQLEPGDWVVLFTDGLVEARDATGRMFGQHRLTDFLHRAASAQQPPSETLRRLVHAVLTHQQDLLQDDATIVIAGWRTGAHTTMLTG